MLLARVTRWSGAVKASATPPDEINDDDDEACEGNAADGVWPK